MQTQILLAKGHGGKKKTKSKWEIPEKDHEISVSDMISVNCNSL
jgi:hypothetical protein